MRSLLLPDCSAPIASCWSLLVVESFVDLRARLGFQRTRLRYTLLVGPCHTYMIYDCARRPPINHAAPERLQGCVRADCLLCTTASAHVIGGFGHAWLLADAMVAGRMHGHAIVQVASHAETIRGLYVLRTWRHKLSTIFEFLRQPIEQAKSKHCRAIVVPVISPQPRSSGFRAYTWQFELGCILRSSKRVLQP